MPFYAFDHEEEFIFAQEAKAQGKYWCVNCGSPLRKRKGKSGYFHFYHLSKSPHCQLYSQSKNHLLAQLQVQSLLKGRNLQLERSFSQINRIADVCVEDKKIIFEIQCSSISVGETKSRIEDYRSLGYEVIWLLDDKRYNKRTLKPEENFLRNHLAYYFSIKRGNLTEIYDQFEIVSGKTRIKKGGKLPIDLRRNFSKKPPAFPLSYVPEQVCKLKSSLFFYKDRTYIANKNYQETLRFWRKLEIRNGKNPSSVLFLVKKYILNPYQKALTKYLRQVH